MENGRYPRKNISINRLYSLFKNRIERMNINSTSKTIPIIILDIDGTIINNFQRQIKIFEDILIPQFPYLVEFNLFEKIKNRRYDPYSILIYIKEIINDEVEFQKIRKSFLNSFLSNEFLSNDVFLKGVHDFLNRINKLGIKTLFLTGRIKDLMKEGTNLMLSKEKLSHPYLNSLLLMKSDIDEEDFDFKYKTFKYLKISSEYKIIGVIDNEASICNKAKELFPNIEIVQFLSNQSNNDIFKGFKLKSWKF